MKTKTKSQIKNEAKRLFKELKRIYNNMDNLMDDAEISAEGLTDKEVQQGKADWLNSAADILQSSRDNVELAMGDLESVTGPMP